MTLGDTRAGLEPASVPGAGRAARDRRNTVASRLVTALLRNFTARMPAPGAVATMQTNALHRAKELAPSSAL